MKERMPPRKNKTFSLSIIILGLSIACTSCCCLSSLKMAEPDIEIRGMYPDATGVTDAHPLSPTGRAEETYRAW